MTNIDLTLSLLLGVSLSIPNAFADDTKSDSAQTINKKAVNSSLFHKTLLPQNKIVSESELVVQKRNYLLNQEEMPYLSSAED